MVGFFCSFFYSSYSLLEDSELTRQGSYSLDGTHHLVRGRFTIPRDQAGNK